MWIHWWFYQKIQLIKKSDILRKFVNILNESADELKWIHWQILMNLLMNSNEFVDEFKWICLRFQMNLLMNSKQFVDELLMNPSEFIKKS